MEIRSKQDLIEYLPNDAPWTVYREPVEALRAQCMKRGLDPTGHVVEVLNRLHRYSQLQPAGERRILPWRYRENPLYVSALYHAQNNTYLVTGVEDNSNNTSIEKRFTLWDPCSSETFDVIIGRVSRCSCPLSRKEVSHKNYVCGHIVYVLRYVLDCPEPLRWQQALLFKELQTIFRFSTALHYAVNSTDCYPNRQCALCFRDVQGGDLTLSHCCELFVHRACHDNALKAAPRGLVECIGHSSGLFWMGTEEASVAAWNTALLPPPVPYGHNVRSCAQSNDEDSDDHMTQSLSDDDAWDITDDGGDNDIFNGDLANRSIEFFAERSQILPGSPSIKSSSSSSAGSVAIDEEPESPCPPPRRQLPSRAAKEATRARPDAYTGSSPRRQALTSPRGPMPKEWTKKLSTTPIPLPVIPGFARQQMFGSQPARRAKIAVPIPIVPASAQGRLRSLQATGYAIPMRTAAAAGFPLAPASASVCATATARSVPSVAASPVAFSGTEVARSSSFSPSPAPYSPPVRLEANEPFVSFPIPPNGSTFASMSLAAPVTATSFSPTKKDKIRETTSSVLPMANQVSNALDGTLADFTTTTTTCTSTSATTATVTRGTSITAESTKQRDRRMTKLVRQMSRLEKDAEKVKQTKEYAEQELKRMERQKKRVMRKMNKLYNRDRDRDRSV